MTWLLLTMLFSFFHMYTYLMILWFYYYISGLYNHHLYLLWQEILGPVPEGYENYFAARFPRLLIEVYKVLYQHCKEERMFRRYFSSIEN